MADLSRAVVGVRGRSADRQPAGQPEGRARVARGDRAGPRPRPRDARRPVRPRGVERRAATPVRARPTRAVVGHAGRARVMFPGLRRRPGLPARLRRCSGARRSSSCWRWPATCASSPRPGPPSEQPRPFGQIGARLVGLIEYAFVQTKMFKDLAGRADARGHLLGLRPADDRDGQRRHRRAHRDGPVGAARRRCSGRRSRRCRTSSR